MNYVQTKVNELRQMLMAHGWTSEELQSMRKPELIELCQQVTPQSNEEDQISDGRPQYCSQEWSEYVISQFNKDELDPNGNPKIHGLRRLTNYLLGPIVSSGPVQLYPSNDPTGPGRASAIVSIIIAFDGDRNDLREFRGAASCFRHNVDDEFAFYPEAMAETRAEARALRKALGLSVVSSDELTSKNAKELLEECGEEWSNTNISIAQTKAINTICNRLNINIEKFINSGDTKYSNISEVSNSTALKMLKQLNKYQTNALEIPKEILNETTS